MRRQYFESRPVIHLEHALVEWTPEGCITYFDDGTTVEATPHPEMPHYHVIAHRCGYGDDVLRYCQEHEVMHSLVAQWLEDQPSVVLWALAHGKQVSGRRAAFEECFAQTMQRFIRANERPIIAGLPLDDWKAEALELLG